MQIIIKYEASWQNSFLDGSNNEPLPRNGRGFVGSMKVLKEKDEDGNYSNFIKREVSHDTVMGVLNRLIGDQRKLYQARKCSKYFFADIENKVKFENIHDQSKPLNSEMVYIRNMNGSTDQNSFTGMIKAGDPSFTSDFSQELWGVIYLDLEKIVNFILDQNLETQDNKDLNPLILNQRFNDLYGEKPILVEGDKLDALQILKSHFHDTDYKLDKKNCIKPFVFYAGALYLQLEKLSKKYDIKPVLSPRGGLSGVSKATYTPKGFMTRYSTGEEKLIWGNPYILEVPKKGEGKVISTLTKANGILEINLDIPKEKSSQIADMIESAGVSSFYLGKKGLAYVEEIRI